LDNFGIIGIFAIGKNDGGDRVQRTEAFDFLIYFPGVVILRVGAKNQKVAAIGAFAQKKKRGILLGSAAHERKAGPGLRGTVGHIASSEIFPFCAGSGSEEDRRQAKKNKRCAVECAAQLEGSGF
jgi:hypothetical protein